MGTVFISYSRKDSDFVDKLMAGLARHGFEFWMDREDIRGGAAWRAAISKAIHECDAFLMVLSPASTGSDNVAKEVSLADQHKRPIVPILYQPCTIPPAMEYLLAELQMVDFVETTYDAGLGRLVGALRALIPLPSEETPKPMVPGMASRRTEGREAVPDREEQEERGRGGSAKGETRIYPRCADRLDDLAAYLRRTYEADGCETQVLRAGDERGGRGLILQIRKGYDANWKQMASRLTGLDTAATVTMKVEGDGLVVEVGGGKWLDKAAVAGFAVFVTLGVLVVPAGIGAWNQRKLLAGLVMEIDNFFKGRAGVPGACAACGAGNKVSAKFCGECGNPLDASAKRPAPKGGWMGAVAGKLAELGGR